MKNDLFKMYRRLNSSYTTKEILKRFIFLFNFKIIIIFSIILSGFLWFVNKENNTFLNTLIIITGIITILTIFITTLRTPYTKEELILKDIKKNKYSKEEIILISMILNLRLLFFFNKGEISIFEFLHKIEPIIKNHKDNFTYFINDLKSKEFNNLGIMEKYILILYSLYQPKLLNKDKEALDYFINSEKDVELFAFIINKAINGNHVNVYLKSKGLEPLLYLNEIKPIKPELKEDLRKKIKSLF
jgi:hypothetical protein